MKKWLLCSAALAASLGSTAVQAQVTALTGGTVVNLAGKAPIENAVILIEGERIKTIGPAASTPVPEGATIVPMQGKWIIPGLMNMHVHLGLNLPGAGRLYGEKPEAKSLRMLDNAQKSLLSGVTTIRPSASTESVARK